MDSDNTQLSRPRKRSPLPLLLTALVVLGLLALLVADPFGLLKPDEAEQAATDPQRRELVGATAEAITAFEIDPPEADAFRLEKDGERWQLVMGERRWQAEMSRVQPLLDDVAALRAEGLATDNVDRHAELEVDSAKAIKLSVFASGETPDNVLLVGKSTPSFTSSFVRLGEAPEVWRAGKNIKKLVGFSAGDYRSKTPWSFDLAEATGISVRAFAEPAEDGSLPAQGEDKLFSKAGDLWQHQGANANQNQLNELLKGLSELSTSEYVEAPDPAVAQLDDRLPSIEVTAGERKVSLTLGAKDVSYVYARDQDGHVYKVSDYGLKFYKDIDFERLSFDDTTPETPAAAAEDGETAAVGSGDSAAE